MQSQRVRNIRADAVYFAKTRCMKKCQHQKRKDDDACKKLACGQKKSTYKLQAE